MTHEQAHAAMIHAVRQLERARTRDAWRLAYHEAVHALLTHDPDSCSVCKVERMSVWGLACDAAINAMFTEET